MCKFSRLNNTDFILPLCKGHLNLKHKTYEEIVEDAEDADLVDGVVTEEVEQLPESYYIEEYAKAAFALNELLD